MPALSAPITDAPRFAALVERARELAVVASAVTAALPGALATECTVANIRQHRLIMLAASATAAARLRLLAPGVLQAAREVSGQALVELTIKVTATQSVPTDPRAESRPLSHAAADHLARAASSLADPELRALFQKLASLA